MRLARLLKPLFPATVLAILAGCLWLARDHWLNRSGPGTLAGPMDAGGSEVVAPAEKIIVNEQAQENLGLVARPLTPGKYWKMIEVPGMVVDRPGVSDRGVTAPVTGVVARITHVPGEAVHPGNELFILKVLSESLHQTQSDLFKSTNDIRFAKAQKKTLADAGGAVPATRIIEADNQIARLEVALRAYRQELLNRGFTADQVDAVAAGTFVSQVAINAPPDSPQANQGMTLKAAPRPPSTFELQELKVDLGQQVQAGQLLCTLANHSNLSIEGRAFRDETPLLERSVAERWPVEVDFQEEASANWGAVGQEFRIRHLSNTIDPITRTFAFRMPLENQSKVVDDGGNSQTLWRFRPGQKVRLHVRVAELANVFVLPADAVARNGPEAFVFTQNVNTFTRRPVRVLLQDRRQVVVANDGSIPAGTYAVQSAAAQLNRMLIAGGPAGVPKGYHVHADGSLHKNEDEGK